MSKWNICWRDRILSALGLGVTAELIDLSDAPGGDLSLDDIFGGSSDPQTTVAVTPNEPQSTSTQTTATDEPVIKTKTGTVYKSIEDAVSGIEHKDALIAQLREQVKQGTGRDPLTAQRPTQPESVSYTDNQDKYFEDIALAVSNKDTRAYMQAQQKLIMDTLGPLAPTITSLSRANAARVVSEEMPEFRGFLGSEQYDQIVQRAPLLADAIRSAENNPQAAAQLPELYRVAYLASQGSRVPELLQSAERHSSQTQARPTVHSTPMPPPANNGVPAVQPSMETAAGRKALIEQMEGRGVQNLRM